MHEDLIAVGKIVKVQGNKGEIRVLSLTDFPERFETQKEIIIIFSDEHKATYTIQYVRYHKGKIVLKLEGVDSIDEASKLVGAGLFISLEDRLPLPENEYYHFELINMQVFTVNGTFLGRIDSIFPTGSNDVYVVKEKDCEYLIPAIKDVIVSVDVKNKKMVISPIKGLFEEDDL